MGKMGFTVVFCVVVTGGAIMIAGTSNVVCRSQVPKPTLKDMRETNMTTEGAQSINARAGHPCVRLPRTQPSSEEFKTLIVRVTGCPGDQAKGDDEVSKFRKIILCYHVRRHFDIPMDTAGSHQKHTEGFWRAGILSYNEHEHRLALADKMIKPSITSAQRDCQISGRLSAREADTATTIRRSVQEHFRLCDISWVYLCITSMLLSSKIMKQKVCALRSYPPSLRRKIQAAMKAFFTIPTWNNFSSRRVLPNDHKLRKSLHSQPLSGYIPADTRKQESNAATNTAGLDLEKNTHASNTGGQRQILSSYFNSFTQRLSTVLTIFPVTNFLPSMGSSTKNVMSHLGCRLASLYGLPASCNVSRVRLAQAGFYYDNNKTTRSASNAYEVVCYSCGLTFSQWTSADNPTTVHQTLQPDCQHLNSLNPEKNLKQLLDGGKESRHCQDVAPEPHEENAERSPNNAGDLEADCSAILPAPLTPSSAESAPRATRPSLVLPTGNRTDPTVNPTNQDSQLASRDSTSGARGGVDGEERPALVMGSAVYPQFSLLQNRRSTFARWPLANHFHPEDLVMQGFYYAGYADCLRCFYCGVGLKSWAENDVVMDEHIRWRPSCGYVLNTKGRHFVNAVLQRLQSNNATQNSESKDSSETTPEATNSTSTNLNQARPSVPSRHMTQSVTSSNTTSASPLSAAAAPPPLAAAAARPISTAVPSTAAGACGKASSSSRDVLMQVENMGFTKDAIARTVRHLQESGATTIGSNDLANAIIELEMNDNNSITTTTTSSDNHNSNSSTGHEDGLQTDGPAAEAATSSIDADCERVQAMVAENERLRARVRCSLCKEASVGMIFMPCGHVVTCRECGAHTNQCPHCGQHIKATANVFFT